jgi:hypothetical protein
MKEFPKYEHLIVYGIIYFFLNSFLLPHGLLFTTLLVPVMIYFLFREKKMGQVLIWSLLLFIPMYFQIFEFTDIRSYIISTMMVFSVYILFFASFYIMKNNEKSIELIFKKTLIINGFLVLVALLILPVGPIRSWLWYTEIITKGLEQIPRLKLLTYEASYYAFIMMPVFLYYILKILNGQQKHAMIISLSILASFLLSFSFGVIGALIIAFLFVVIVYWKKSNVFLRRFVILGGVSFVSIIAIIMIVWPENPIYFRINNIIKGEDTSAMGRLLYSFMFAKDLVFRYNPIFGIGPGQVKIIAHDMIVNHYQYHGSLAEIVRIPNSMAEMLATYGFFGFLLKLFLQIYFFFKWKIFRNLYAFILFLFMFIYQFTGSFITNAAEIVNWAIVFGLRFPAFEMQTTPKEE